MANNNQEFLDLLKKIREEKNIDEIGELFLSVITMYGLTVDEVSAIAYYLVDTTLKANHNKLFMEEHFNIDIDKLGIDGKLSIMKAMIATYTDKVSNSGKS